MQTYRETEKLARSRAETEKLLRKAVRRQLPRKAQREAAIAAAATMKLAVASRLDERGR